MKRRGEGRQADDLGTHERCGEGDPQVGDVPQARAQAEGRAGVRLDARARQPEEKQEDEGRGDDRDDEARRIGEAQLGRGDVGEDQRREGQVEAEAVERGD